jgi:hypothetical protein
MDAVGVVGLIGSALILSVWLQEVQQLLFAQLAVGVLTIAIGVYGCVLVLAVPTTSQTYCLDVPTLVAQLNGNIGTITAIWVLFMGARLVVKNTTGRA